MTTSAVRALHMALSRKMRQFDDQDIVKYGVDAPLVGVARGRESRELRDMALILGATLHLSGRAREVAPVKDDGGAPSAP